MQQFKIEDLERYRDVRFHRTRELRATNEESALAFINEIGFCFLFGDKSIAMPTLFSAVSGSRRPVPRQHDDADLGHAWQWKDTLPASGAVYYGKLLRDTATLVSLDLLPTFYALSPNFGDIDDYMIQYQEGQLTVEAKNVYEGLMNEGAMATSRLRQLAGLGGGGSNARRFERAIVELQRELKIVKVGISDANRWGYAYVYDLFIRRFPDVPALARSISTDEAMQRLTRRYLENVGVQVESKVQRLFQWDDWEWGRLVERMAASGAIERGVRIEGQRGRCVAIAGISLPRH